MAIADDNISGVQDSNIANSDVKSSPTMAQKSAITIPQSDQAPDLDKLIEQTKRLYVSNDPSQKNHESFQNRLRRISSNTSLSSTDTEPETISLAQERFFKVARARASPARFSTPSRRDIAEPPVEPPLFQNQDDGDWEDIITDGKPETLESPAECLETPCLRLFGPGNRDQDPASLIEELSKLAELGTVVEPGHNCANTISLYWLPFILFFYTLDMFLHTATYTCLCLGCDSLTETVEESEDISTDINEYGKFEKFMELPPELRIEIWKMSLPAPRVVEVYTAPCKRWESNTFECNDGHDQPIPAVHHVHQESRNLGLIAVINAPRAKPYWFIPMQDTISFWVYLYVLRPTEMLPLMWQINAIKEQCKRRGPQEIVLHVAADSYGFICLGGCWDFLNKAREISGLRKIKIRNSPFRLNVSFIKELAYDYLVYNEVVLEQLNVLVPKRHNNDIVELVYHDEIFEWLIEAGLTGSWTPGEAKPVGRLDFPSWYRGIYSKVRP